ncbi:hypothetical protein [Azospirillum argentinense]
MGDGRYLRHQIGDADAPNTSGREETKKGAPPDGTPFLDRGVM